MTHNLMEEIVTTMRMIQPDEANPAGLQPDDPMKLYSKTLYRGRGLFIQIQDIMAKASQNAFARGPGKGLQPQWEKIVVKL